MKEITIEELSDFDGTLEELQDIIYGLILEHGEYSRIKTDAGHNNVDFKLKEYEE